MTKPVHALHLRDAAPIVFSDPVVRLEQVSKTYPARADGAAVHAIADLDLTLAEGTILGVIGRSGAGKSTLIRLVNGLEKPTRGRVVVDGTEVSSLDERGLRDVRRRVGMIFQHFNLLAELLLDQAARSQQRPSRRADVPQGPSTAERAGHGW